MIGLALQSKDFRSQALSSCEKGGRSVANTHGFTMNDGLAFLLYTTRAFPLAIMGCLLKAFLEADIFVKLMASASLHTNLTNPHSKASSRGKRKADEEAAKELFELDVIGHRLVRDGPDSPLRDEFQVRRPAHY